MTDAPHNAGAPAPDPLAPDRDLSGAFALLAETTRQFADSMDLEAALLQALGMIVQHLGAEAGSLWLLDDDAETITCRASVGTNQITGLSLPVTKGIIGKSVRDNQCLTVLDVSKDPNFAGAVDEESGFVTHSLLCAPMSLSDRPIGAIEVVNKVGGDRHFTEAEVNPLRILASSAALAIANARMAKSLVDQERVQRELELAAEIQRTLLPDPQPDLPVVGVNIPAREVSGDFYDFLVRDDGRICFCIGDVSGKGMNAAILMAKTASLYRCLAKSLERPGELLGALNEEICETATRGMFVTMAAGVFDVTTGCISLANAGHEPPLWQGAGGQFGCVPADAPPLGIAPGIVPGGIFPESDLPLEGGALYLFTDGLTEAETDAGEQIGAEGVQELIARFAAKPLVERVDAIVAEASLLTLRDDLTLLALCDPGSVGR